MGLKRDKTKKYRLCENCPAVYSTGKDYEDVIENSDFFGQYTDCEKKGLCPFCNEKSLWYLNKEQMKKHHANKE